MKALMVLCIVLFSLFIKVSHHTIFAGEKSSCPEKANVGDYNCDTFVTLADFESWRKDYIRGISSFSYFENFRRGFKKNLVNISPTIKPAGPTRVLFVSIDPRLKSGKRLTQEYQMIDPTIIVQGVIERLSPYTNISLADIQIYESFPPMILDDKKTIEDTVVSCMNDVGPHNTACKTKGWQADHNKLFSELNICDRVNNNEIDEVWLGTYPYSGFGEADMVGPNPFFINGFVIKNTLCKKNVPTLAIDYNYPGRGSFHNKESGIGVTLHSLGHRIESTMSYVFGPWNIYTPKTDWDIFSFPPSGSPNPATSYGCGSIHFPPNAHADYDYANSTSSFSYCDDLLQYPNLKSIFSRIPTSCTTWGCSQIGYMEWWLKHLPHADGYTKNAKRANWYDYVFNIENAIADSVYSSPNGTSDLSILTKNLHTPFHYYK